MGVQVGEVMLIKVEQTPVVLVAQETHLPHHQLKAQMAAQVVLTIQMIIIYNQEAAVVLVKLVKLVKQLPVVKAVMVHHPLFLDRL
jgi:hypothetical protein